MLSVTSWSFLENALEESILVSPFSAAFLTQSWDLSVCDQVREVRKRARVLFAADICKSLLRFSANVGIHCNPGLVSQIYTYAVTLL